MILLATMVTGALEGGIPVVNRLILDAAGAAGIPCSVVSLMDGPPSHVLPWDLRSFTGAGGSKGRFALAAARAARADPGSLILATHVRLASVGRFAARLAGSRFGVCLHGVEAWRPLRFPTSWGLRGCHRIVAFSEFTVREFRRVNPGFEAVPERVCNLPSRSLGSADGVMEPGDGSPPRALLVGRLWGRGLWKGQDLMIDLWPGVLEHLPTAELWIVGDGEGRADLQGRAVARGVADSVKFLGTVSDEELDRVYRSCDVYCMPSRGEGFGLVFAEAMARGLPCIASRLDAGAEVVADGVTGIVVSPDHREEVAAAVLRLLSDPGLRRTMGAAGRARAASLYSLEGFRERMAGALRELGA